MRNSIHPVCQVSISLTRTRSYTLNRLQCVELHPTVLIFGLERPTFRPETSAICYVSESSIFYWSLVSPELEPTGWTFVNLSSPPSPTSVHLSRSPKRSKLITLFPLRNQQNIKFRNKYRIKNRYPIIVFRLHLLPHISSLSYLGLQVPRPETRRGRVHRPELKVIKEDILFRLP